MEINREKLTCLLCARIICRTHWQHSAKLVAEFSFQYCYIEKYIERFRNPISIPTVLLPTSLSFFSYLDYTYNFFYISLHIFFCYSSRRWTFWVLTLSKQQAESNYIYHPLHTKGCVKTYILENMKIFKGCFSDGNLSNRKLRGRVAVSWRISSTKLSDLFAANKKLCF